MIINVEYFLCKWKKKFNSKQTKDALFTTSSGEKLKCKMMSTEFLSIGYYADNDCQVIELEYTDNSIKAYVVLPVKDINTFINNTTSSNLSSYISQCAKGEVNLEMPRFKIETNMEFSEILSEMGIKEAFSLSADFSSMTNEKLFVDSIIQKTFITVDE